MSDEVGQLYFEWLVDQVGDGTGFDSLLRLLHEKQYIFIVANDDNRAEDAEDLRKEFLNEPAHERWLAEVLHPYISVLEVLIGLSRRLEFATESPALSWAVTLLENLELHKMRGELKQTQINYVDEILERLLWRQYQPDGLGGFFPLAWPEDDQREVELWYQMAAYLEEQVEL